MSSIESTVERFATDGYVILESLLDERELRELTDALAPYERERPMGRNAFEGLRTQRVYSLVNKGEPFLRLIEHPRVVEIVDRLLLPNWLLSTSQTIRLHPGEPGQAWHTDDAFYLVPRPRARLAVSAIWALEDFTDDNGATELYPGSHRWAGEHPDDLPPASVKAIMPAGSVVLFDGATWHRGGANSSTGTRLALSPQYCQPWLRPQESQLLLMPPERARACTPRMRSMLGYSIHPPFIGQVEGMNPVRLVDESYHSGNRGHLSEEAQRADAVLQRPTSVFKG